MIRESFYKSVNRLTELIAKVGKPTYVSSRRVPDTQTISMIRDSR